MAKATHNSSIHMTSVKEVVRRPPYSLETGLVDDKGRRVGGLATRGTVDAVEGPINRHTSFRGLAPGRYFWACVQVTRDGKAYGASQDAAFFTTEAERDAYVEQRFDAVQKSAEKKAKYR